MGKFCTLLFVKKDPVCEYLLCNYSFLFFSLIPFSFNLTPSSSEINHSCTQREILWTQCDDKMKHVWSKPCVPACPELCYLLKEHVPNVFGFCYPLWLQCSLSLEFMISEATARTHLTGHFWNVKPGGFTQQHHSVLLSRQVWPIYGHLVFEGFWGGLVPFPIWSPRALSKWHGSIMIWKQFCSSKQRMRWLDGTTD